MRPNAFIRLSNGFVTSLLRIGAPMGSMALLSVPGRRTGRLHTTPVTLTSKGEGWVLGSPFGETDWVRNLRAAGKGTITRRGSSVEVLAREIDGEDAARIMMENMASVGPVARRALAPYFAIPLDAPLRDWIVEAPRHPMFRLETMVPGSAQ